MQQVPGEYEKSKFQLPDMSHQEMDDILRKQIICRISFNDRPYPYTLPMEYYYFGDVMYFHFTNTGKKWELINKDPNVTVEVDWANDNLSDYKSVILHGRLIVVENEDERNTMSRVMADAVNSRLGIKALLNIPWGKKGIDYLSASDIPLVLLKLEERERTGKKAH